jgi:anhydro-N-acetylmuramic acid kinase
VIGLMSGTSADGIDVAIVEIAGSYRDTRAELLHFCSLPLAPALRRRIWGLPDGKSANICELNFLVGEAFADAVKTALAQAKLSASDVHLVGSHGQTARHQPPPTASQSSKADGYAVPCTLQIGEGAVIAERTGLPVICDFRVADMAAGGHGAPLIPLVDFLLFSKRAPCVLLNLGGIANITVVDDDPEAVLAFDTGPANMALDAVARAATGGHQNFDHDAAIARQGQVDRGLLTRLLEHPYFDLQPPKSTGREAFGRDFVYPLLDSFSERLPDLMATLVELTVESIARAIERFVSPQRAIKELIASGGGVHNPLVMFRLAERLAPIPVCSSEKAGLDPDAKEALGFAILANETLFGNPGNLVGATGAKGRRLLGKICLAS